MKCTHLLTLALPVRIGNSNGIHEARQPPVVGRCRQDCRLATPPDWTSAPSKALAASTTAQGQCSRPKTPTSPEATRPCAYWRCRSEHRIPLPSAARTVLSDDGFRRGLHLWMDSLDPLGQTIMAPWLMDAPPGAHSPPIWPRHRHSIQHDLGGGSMKLSALQIDRHEVRFVGLASLSFRPRPTTPCIDRPTKGSTSMARDIKIVLRSALFRDNERLQLAASDHRYHVTLGDEGEHVRRLHLFLLFSENVPLRAETGTSPQVPGQPANLSPEEIADFWDQFQTETFGALYGPRTADLVRSFKSRNDIVDRSRQAQADGVVGVRTIREMDRWELIPKYSGEPSEDSRRDMAGKVAHALKPAMMAGPTVAARMLRT